MLAPGSAKAFVGRDALPDKNKHDGTTFDRTQAMRRGQAE